MATSFSEIYDIFHTKFQSSTALPDGLEKQFLINSFSDFYTSLSKQITYDSTTETISTSLNDPEKQLLAKYMYKQYLMRERDRVAKLTNMVGKDIRYTGYDGKQRSFDNLIEKIDGEINYDVAKLMVF